MIRLRTLMYLPVLFAIGCGGAAEKPAVVVQDEKVKESKPEALAGAGDNGGSFTDLPAIPTNATPEEKYSAALGEAFKLMADRKETEALAKLEEAQKFQDSDYVKSEIGRLRKAIETKNAAEKTASDIKVILDAGRADEAAKLAADALLQFGDSEAANTLAYLKRQADAVLTTQLENAGQKTSRFVEEATAALEGKNVRAAVLAYEQAVANGATDATIKARFEPYQLSLKTYDENRSRGLELRRDPSKLEEALAALKTASQAMNTPQIAQEISETEMALSRRRDLVAIAPFEVLGDIGVPNAGQAIAEEILPHFRSRFDVVERATVNAIAQEQKLGENWASDSAQFVKVGALAKARYMVVGSVNRLYGISVNARMVEVNTGLVVQTAKIAAGTPEELMKKLPMLAKLLSMNDQEKIAYDREISQAAAIQTAPTTSNIAPPPAAPAPEAVAGPAMVINANRPPDFGQVTVAELDGLAAIPGGTVVIIDAPNNIRQRSLNVALQIGDDLYLHRRFAEALHYYEFALTLVPGSANIRARIDNCRPFLPPPPPVVIIPRPRMIVMPFAEFGRPFVIPPGTGVWTADMLAWQFAGGYDIVDRGELFWWMGRLGISVRDVAVNSYARLCLARALNARFMVMGSLRETASFDVTTNLLDVETNTQIGGGRMHVFNTFELKCRMGELARLTTLPPAQQVVFVQQQQVVQQNFVQAEVHIKSGKFDIAIGLYKNVLVQQPNNTQALVQLQFCETRQRQWELEQARQEALAREQERLRYEQQQQFKFALKAEQQRKKAEQDAAIRGFAENQKFAQQRLVAQQGLLTQARAYFRQGQYPESLNAYEGAYNMTPNDAILQEMGTVRAAIANARAQKDAQFAANRALFDPNQQARAAQAASIAQQQQQQQVSAIQTLQETQKKKDTGEYTRLLDVGQRAQAAGKLKEAVAAYQAARRINPTPEADRLVNASLVELAKQEAAAKGDAEKKALETQLAAETEKRKLAEAEAAKNQQKYEAALLKAKQALAAKKYDEAESGFKLAALTSRTPETETGLRQVRDERSKLTAEADAKKRAEAEQARVQKQIDEQVAVGTAALGNSRFDEAVKAFKAAAALKPADASLQANVAKAEQARDKFRLELAQKSEAEKLAVAKKNAEVKQKEMDTAKIAQAKKDADAKAELLKKKADDAKMAQLKKDEDAKAELLKKQAEDARMAQLKGTDAAKLKSSLENAKLAVAAKRFDSADALLAEARKIAPTDPAVAALAKEIADGRAADKLAMEKQIAEAKAAAEKKNADKAAMDKQIADAKAATEKKNADKAAMDKAAAEAAVKKQYMDAMNAGVNSYNAKKYAEAAASFEAAMKVIPNDPTAVKYLDEARKAAATIAVPKVEPKGDPKMEPKGDPKKDPVPNSRVVFNQLLAQGRAALAQKKYDDANRSVAEALRLVPNDPDAVKLQADIRAAMAPPVDPKNPLPPKVDAKMPDPNAAKAQAYQQSMQAARQAVAQNKLPEAAAAVGEALKAVPNDPAALQLQQQLQAAMAPKKDPPKDDPAAKFRDLVQAAQVQDAKGKYAEAVGLYSEALKLNPNDANIRKRSAFCSNMAQGQKLLAQGKFTEADTEFANALKEYPNDNDARQWQAKARAKKK